MTKEKYLDDILKFLADKEGQTVRLRKLARRMGVSDEAYGDFRAAFKKLRDQGRIVLGAKNALTLPVAQRTLTGRFQANPKGFGFVVPSDPEKPGDLFIPAGRNKGAMTGDLVTARLLGPDNSDSSDRRYTGEVLEILERGLSKCVGTLNLSEGTWFVIPDGVSGPSAVVVRDVPKELRKQDAKVQVEIMSYPDKAGGLPEGVIVEILGPSGELGAEILSIMRSQGLSEVFPEAALADARLAASRFDPENAPDREDLTSLVVVTIDPETARDYDDAISLTPLPGKGYRLGVHIADVSHFVRPGGALDAEAYDRGTSVYFPRKTVPMLPEVISNGVCSLQEGVKRFTKSVFIDYDEEGRIISKRFANTVVKSKKRLTYEEAQRIIDGKAGRLKKEIVALVLDMETLARRIERRRAEAGMLHLELKEVELILDDDGRVQGARPADASYTHKIIEMFMVEANDAVATLFHELEIPIIRRIHPLPEEESLADLRRFVAACGHSLPKKPTPKDLQALIAESEGKPESYAVNLALLRSFQRASYSVDEEPHFALSSPHYCHFTSPIRRCPDLTVHRALEAHLQGKQKTNPQDEKALVLAAGHLSERERAAEQAERVLRLVMVLHHLAEKTGESFHGIITGVADFGIFVQSPTFLVEGLVRLQDLGDDWWNVYADQGRIVGEITGKVYRIGDTMEVVIDRVDIAKRHLDLSLPKKLRKKKERPGGFNGSQRARGRLRDSKAQRQGKKRRTGQRA